MTVHVPDEAHPEVKKAIQWFNDAERDQARAWKTRLCAKVLRVAADGLDGPPGGEKAQAASWVREALAVADGGPADGLEALWAASDDRYTDLGRASMVKHAVHYLAGHLLGKPADQHGAEPWQRSVLYAACCQPQRGFDWLYAMAAEDGP